MLRKILRFLADYWIPLLTTILGPLIGTSLTLYYFYLAPAPPNGEEKDLALGLVIGITVTLITYIASRTLVSSIETNSVKKKIENTADDFKRLLSDESDRIAKIEIFENVDAEKK
ncbi:hypothetical protein DXV76_03580 [Rhodobacteraceae bacterium CCMM004]|nr:hypothetical protein DXV76_03580 [Rhodobacteraceae bacterium CCMM004]